jgi:hypothetical protein
LARSATNALRAGLFSRLLVLPALGETVEEYDAFRSSIAADLNPVGALETELADRITLLLWRLRRVVRYETAAMMATGTSLPPHPDTVAPLSGDAIHLPIPQNPPVEYRLARLRTALASADVYLAARRSEATILDPERTSNEPIDVGTAYRLLSITESELGWAPRPDPWPAVFASAGVKQDEIVHVKWTVGRMRRVLRVAAEKAGREYDAFLVAIRVRLRMAAEEYETRIVNNRREEAELAEQMLRTREAAATARLYTDDGFIQRIARAESSLSRELDRALTRLADRQIDGRQRPVGFVLQNVVSADQPVGVPTAIQNSKEG